MELTNTFSIFIIREDLEEYLPKVIKQVNLIYANVKIIDYTKDEKDGITWTFTTERELKQKTINSLCYSIGYYIRYLEDK